MTTYARARTCAGINYTFLTLKERDNETGLDYFEARYYSSTQGRFTSVDPDNAGASELHPQSWNGYAYSLNNPLRFIDPDGLRWAEAAVEGAIHYQWFDDKEKDGQTEYDRALGGGWSKVHFNESKDYTFVSGLIAPGETLKKVTLSPNGPDSSALEYHTVTWREWSTLVYAASYAGGISDKLISDLYSQCRFQRVDKSPIVAAAVVDCDLYPPYEIDQI